jgi:hypothetical protein
MKTISLFARIVREQILDFFDFPADLWHLFTKPVPLALALLQQPLGTSTRLVI